MVVDVVNQAQSEPSALPPAVQLREVSYHYPDGHRALADLNLTIHSGERVAILGPNGAGKTTLALHFNGVYRPTHGSVEICGTPIDDRDLLATRRRVGIVFQDPDDQLFLPTVAEDVAFGPANLGLGGSALEHRVHSALEAVDMTNCVDRAPHHLSFGQRRRVAVATVLAMQPDIIVLDEPSSNLDPISRHELADILATIPATLVVITHDLPYALQFCSRAIILDSGQIVADGSMQAILSDSALLARHRLALPYGFDHRLLRAASPQQQPPR